MPEIKCGAAEKVKPAASPEAEKPADIAGNISYHAQYSPHFSPFAFGPEQAFYATAESVRDHLIQVRESARARRSRSFSLSRCCPHCTEAEA
jgi:glycogen phosphorylase